MGENRGKSLILKRYRDIRKRLRQLLQENVHILLRLSRPAVEIHRITDNKTYHRLIFGILFKIFYYLCRLYRLQGRREYAEGVAYSNSHTLPSVVYSYDSVHTAGKVKKKANMSKTYKDNKPSKFRLAVIDDRTHQHLLNVHFTRTGFLVALVSIFVVLTALIYSIIAFTTVRTFIPGYPDSQSKRVAIQNAMRIDSLENVIYRWELYSENLRRVVEGEEPLKIDSLINAGNRAEATKEELAALAQKDSLLRQHVKEEEQFGISDRDKRNLPIEGLHFFTPLKGVVSQGYDAAVHPYIDIAAPAGSVVKATLDGTVISAGWSDDTGHTIQIQHEGDIISIYKHNEKLLKKTGDKVTAGSPIALSGNTGSLSTGEHLHFELWYKGESVDPTKYISF